MNRFNVAALSLSVKSLTEVEFKNKVEYFVSKAKAHGAELILLPEYCFAPIITFANNEIVNASDITEAFLVHLSNKYGIAVCGCGIYKSFENIYNRSYFISDGKIIYQQKINLIESEKASGLSGGSAIKIIETSFAKLAILICYDIEFPELTRLVVKQGANLILLPSYTLNEFGANRVEFCARARAIENHIYVLKSCLIGDDGHELEAPSGKGLSALYSPCDVPFNENGIVASATSVDEDSLCIGEVNFSQLIKMKESASTMPFEDYLELAKKTINVDNLNF